MRPWKLFPLVVLLLTPAWTAQAESALVDLSTPMTGKATYVFLADGTPAERGVPLLKFEPEIDPRGNAPAIRASAERNISNASRGPAACGGSTYGATSCVTARPKVHLVVSYQRRDRTAVRTPFRVGRRR